MVLQRVMDAKKCFLGFFFFFSFTKTFSQKAFTELKILQF